MKTLKIKILILGTSLAFGLASCEKNKRYDYFQIQVDEFSCPDTVNINEHFKINFKGIIGYTGNYQFHQYKTNFIDNTIEIEAWGKLDKEMFAVPQYVTVIDNDNLEIQLIEKGRYNLKVKNPDGKSLTRNLEVE